MKDYAVQNLMWFREHFSHVYCRVSNRQPDAMKVRLVPAKNEQMNVEMLVQNNWVSLHSRYNPEQEAIRWAQQLQLDVDELIIIGVGLGYHVKSVLELYPNIKVHLFEPNIQILLAALQGGVYFTLPSHRILSFSVGYDDDEEKFRTSVREFFEPFLDKVYQQKVKILYLPSYQRWFQKENNIISDVVKKLIENKRIELHTILVHEHRWTLNALKNLPFTLTTPSVQVLREKLNAKPLVIVSSGPSMEKEVEVLRQNRNRAIILAAGSSVNGMVYHGILPHAVVSFDPAPPNKNVFDLLNSYSVQIPLIFGTTIYHEILSDYQFNNMFHVIISQDTITPLVFQHLGEYSEPVMSDAPSVAILALQLAIYWECNPIIFVGQDFATPNNKFYAVGVSHSREQYLTAEERERYFEVEKVGGGTVLTSIGLNQMRENMEMLLNAFLKNNSNLLVINTSADGARIQGTVEMPLHEAFRVYGTEETRYDDWFQSKENPLHLEWLAEAKRYLNNMFVKQTDFDRIMDELAEIKRKLQRTEERKRLIKIFSELDRLTLELQEQQLFQVVYYPMLRTQFDLYNRMSAQVYNQFASVEKARLIQQRLEAILDAYHRAKELILEHIDSFLSAKN